jgi:hypothetical protein
MTIRRGVQQYDTGQRIRHNGGSGSGLRYDPAHRGNFFCHINRHSRDSGGGLFFTLLLAGDYRIVIVLQRREEGVPGLRAV